jgi:hypothetical protein
VNDSVSSGVIDPSWDFLGIRIMHLVVSRKCPFIDARSLEVRNGREALFRQNDGSFILYLSDSDGLLGAEERLVRLDARAALIWANEPPENRGSFWE